ncbi:metallophosphoesterase family protein [Kluyvera sp. EC_51]|uniref:metallophosphoesterase family protein n=1 Tax=Kluyvera sp. EC_51 TaxID=2584089 RepID=UPI001C709B69|nr:metallophosphoesterase family protein [Kluyvera sp. EC_51]MBW9461890.1 metallophosphoesterase family protein [Kluyvera sp. EC_51]
MLYRFAIFSDVHANLPALDAVLADIDHHDITQCFCLGDVVDFAPWPNEVIARLRERQIPVLRGNHDQRVACDEPVTTMAVHSPEERDARVEAIALSKRVLSEENRRWLQALPDTLRPDLPLPILLVHASPRSLSEYLYADTSARTLLAFPQLHDVDALICGHTHFACVREIDRGTRRPLLFANPGAVGRIKPGQPQASWLSGEIREGKLSLMVKTVQYDVEQVVQAIRDSEVPDYYADELMRRIAQ